MNDERWENLIHKTKANFEVVEHDTVPVEIGKGEVEYIIFLGPLGKIKLERVSRPVVLDKKTNYSRRIGGEVNVEYIYSEDEKSHTFKAWRWDENKDEWEEMKADNFIA